MPQHKRNACPTFNDTPTYNSYAEKVNKDGPLPKEQLTPQLMQRFVDEHMTDNLVGELFDMTARQVAQRRRRYGMPKVYGPHGSDPANMPQLAKMIAYLCFRNIGLLEDLHSGTTPETHTGDYSDVYVTDADGTRIPWNEAAKINQGQMCKMNKEAADRVYTMLTLFRDTTLYLPAISPFLLPAKWREPQVDMQMLQDILDSPIFKDAATR